MKTRHITDCVGNRQTLIFASSPACVGVVMIAASVAVAELTSLLLEDAGVSTVSPTVKLCCDGAGAVSELPLVNSLRFFSAV